MIKPHCSISKFLYNVNSVILDNHAQNQTIKTQGLYKSNKKKLKMSQDFYKRSTKLFIGMVGQSSILIGQGTGSGDG